MDPSTISTLDQLAQAIAVLRRRVAPEGKVQVTVRDLARSAFTGPSTLHPYLRGERLFPQDIYLRVLNRLGITDPDEVKAWLAAWERTADSRHTRNVQARSVVKSFAAGDGGTTTSYRVVAGRRSDEDRHVVIAAGKLRQFRCADVWVNSENTKMEMPRFDEHSISAIIRYEGSVRDGLGNVVTDVIAEELESAVQGRRPVVPGTAIATGSGQLAVSHGVRFIVHVAAVQGQPGAGYRPVTDIGGCVLNSLRVAENLGGPDDPVRSVLIPLLGTGVAGGELEPTVHSVLSAVIDHLTSLVNPHLRTVYVLASTPVEYEVCRAVFSATSRLTAV